jgi:uncharacterized repeat protein (TIGR01451 family)
MKPKLALIALALGLCLTWLILLLVQANRASADIPAGESSAHTTASLASLDPTSPTLAVRLIFIHHSTGEYWLSDGNGDLGIALRDNNYFVSDTNYGWGPPDLDTGSGTIGDHTDIPNWYSWFTGPHRDAYLAALYTEGSENASYSRLADNPGGPNTIIMFKSCFPNSNLDGNPDDPPAPSADNNSPLTIANAKRIYLDLLNYFATRQDKLFVVITAPPLGSFDTDTTRAANARAFNNWLVTSWLADYAYNNVAVFDFYNVLTSNGGDWNTNDLGSLTGNHHRYRNSSIEWINNQGDNVSAYPSSSGDSHPSQAGNLKATGEFVSLLNVFYHRWQAGNSYQTVSNRTPLSGENVTFTIVIRGLAAPLTATVYLTDVVPAGLSYVPGTLAATAGTVVPTDPILRWSGMLSPSPMVTVTYAAKVVATTPTAILHTTIIDAPGYQTLTLDTTLIANGYAIYMPLVTRN